MAPSRRGEAGNVQYDSVSHSILVDVQGRNDLAIIDPHANRVIRRVFLPGCTTITACSSTHRDDSRLWLATETTDYPLESGTNGKPQLLIMKPS